MMFPKPPKTKKKSKASPIRKSANGQECQVRLPGICNFNPATTILAHKNGAGWSLKNTDLLGAYCCSACHNVIDGHSQSILSKEAILVYFYEGVFRTQQILVERGFIEYQGI